MRIIKKPNLASAMYNAVQPKVFGWTVPSWYVSRERQLERARQLWPSAVLPEPPKEVTPQTRSEVLPLHVPDTFDSLWDKIVAPDGYTKDRRGDVKSNKRLVPNKVEFVAPIWLAFDPEYGKGMSPDSFWGQSEVRLAASEILSALIQFPKWSLAWFTGGASAPTLTGYQLEYEGYRSFVPYLHRWDGKRQLRLGARRPDYRLGYWSSPSVREC